MLVGSTSAYFWVTAMLRVEIKTLETFLNLFTERCRAWQRHQAFSRVWRIYLAGDSSINNRVGRSARSIYIGIGLRISSLESGHTDFIFIYRSSIQSSCISPSVDSWYGVRPFILQEIVRSLGIQSLNCWILVWCGFDGCGCCIWLEILGVYGWTQRLVNEQPL